MGFGADKMKRTKSGLPKYCSWNTDQHGRRRVRFRRHGFSTYLNGTPWSDAFMREYGNALEGIQEQRKEIGSARTIHGSFDALFVSYYRAPEVLGVQVSTQALAQHGIDLL